MAKIQTNVREHVYHIKRWLGVNEAPEGEATLKFGEAAAMRNFRITSGGALQKRPGSRNVAGLMTRYDVVTSGDSRVVFTDYTYCDRAMTMYPRLGTSSVGSIVPDGAAVTVNKDNAAQYAGYFYQYGGTWYRLDSVTYTPIEHYGMLQKAIGANSIDTYLYEYAYAQPPVFHDGTWSLQGGTMCSFPLRPPNGMYVIMRGGYGSGPTFGFESSPEYYLPYFNTVGVYAYVTGYGGYTSVDNGYSFTGEYEYYKCASWAWSMTPMRVQSNGASTRVQGIWSGFVAGREVLCAACNGNLWELEERSGGWTKTSCGTLDTSREVHLFGFDEKLYILNGSAYKVWDGYTLQDVAGYRPLVTVSTPPAGGGVELERVNLLTGGRRCWFSPDGASTVFRLPEKGIQTVNWVRDRSTGSSIYCSVNQAEGTLTFSTPPAAGTNTIEAAWTMSTSYRARVTGMRFAELYNGVQDTRVFLYGDGSNKVLYSGLDHEGQARADYFPDMNEAAIGDDNTPVTAMIRHYNRLLCFKLDSAWSLYYDTITLEGGGVTAGFYVSPVNRDIGNCAPGQARLVENRPRTLDGRSVIEWRATSSSGNVTGDQRNAQRVSQRVESTIRTFDLATARTFYDKITHEYYVIGSGGEALVHNVEADAWYTYTNFKAVCMINYKDEVYYGTADGNLRHFSPEYLTDEGGEAIDAWWESGAMDFGEDFRRKYSAMLWVGIRPEEAGYLAVTAETDRKSDFAEYSFTTDDAGAVPTMARIRLKAKKFTYYKLVLRSDQRDTAATVVSADLRVRGTGYVR